MPIHVRGSYARLGEIVPRGLPRFLAGPDHPPVTAGSGRRELAAWLGSPANPLPARVIVNRVWQWHFGRGLVATANNLGLLAQPPSHPELLDWLACRFLEEGRSLKALHRRIVLSATYRQSARAAPQSVTLDPENRLLGRMAPRRLEAEAIRDAMLAAAGTLDSTPGGPAGDDIRQPRRSLYLQTARWDRSGFSTLFDAANPDASVERRDTSTVAPQALFMLNGPFVRGVALDFASRLAREEPDGPSDVADRRIDRAWRLLLGRSPNAEERSIARGVVDAGGAEGWTDLAWILLTGNEATYVD